MTVSRLVAAALIAVATPLGAEPTRVIVRAQSLDAKFIGDHTGGAAVVLRDARSGRVLARGTTTGETGDTALLMRQPHARRTALTGPTTAGFAATIDIDAPTLVRAELRAPLGHPQAIVTAAAEQWLLPGHDVTGDGWIVPMAGLIVEPGATSGGAAGLRIDATVTLLCGCPIEPGGVWDAADYRIEAALLRGKRIVATGVLAPAGKPSAFAGALTAVPPGRYRLRLTAADAQTRNVGVWTGAVTLR